jgi:hypothetical protein
MKLRALAAALLLSVLLSGCSFVGLDAETLMQPPQPTGEKADIHALLESKTGGKMTLKYPRTGDYRSAIITHDICGDKTEEAIAIFQKGDESTGTDIMFMEKDGKWKDIGFFSNPATQVDRVCFGDLNGDGKDEVVVGWGNSLNSTSSICAYDYANGKMNEIKLDKLEQNYTEMEVMDFTGDGKSEIFTANVSTGDSQPALARLYRLNDNAFEMIGSCRLDGKVSKYASVQAGLINTKQKGVVLDGIRSANQLVTELIYWNAKTKSLQSPFYDPATQSVTYTVRPTQVVSQDINNDKIIEIPMVSLLPGYDDVATEDAAYVTNWNRYDTANNTLVRVMSMVLDSSDGYWFLVPDLWRDKITTKTDTATRTLTFYEWNSSSKKVGGSIGAPLLKLQVFSEKEWDSGTGTAGFFKIMDSDSLVFAASCPSPSNPLSLSANDVKDSFELIQPD